MVFDPVTLGVGAGLSLFDKILGDQNKDRALDIENNNQFMQMALQKWQKEQGERGIKMAGAKRTDAFGNSTEYDDVLNEWITKLSPTQRRLTSAGEQEQLRQLTTDAQRNRSLREKEDQFSAEAGEDYAEKRAAYKYGGPKSEDATRGELQALLQRVSEEKASNKIRGASASALRQGRGALLPNLLQAEGRDSSSDFASNLLKARQMALGETQQRDQAHEGKYLPALSRLDSARRGKPSSFAMSETPNRLASEVGEGNKAMLSAIASMMKGVSGVENKGAKIAAADTFDPKTISSLVAAMSGRGGYGRTGTSGGSGGGNRYPGEHSDFGFETPFLGF